MAGKGRRIAWASAATAALVLFGAGLALRVEILEWWYLSRLGSPDEAVQIDAVRELVAHAAHSYFGSTQLLVRVLATNPSRPLLHEEVMGAAFALGTPAVSLFLRERIRLPVAERPEAAEAVAGCLIYYLREFSPRAKILGGNTEVSDQMSEIRPDLLIP